MANYFHETAKISKMCAIDESSRGTDTRIGPNSVIDDFVKIKHVGGSGHVVLGSHVYVNSGCVLYSGNGITIGNDVLIGPGVCIVPVNHAFARTDTPIRLQGFSTEGEAGIVIEDDVWIGANATILDGARVRQGCVIAAGAVVRGELEPYGVYGGVPARLLRSRKA